MSRASGAVRYGLQEVGFRISYVPRATMEIAVHPDRRVTVKVPPGTSYDDIQKRVIKRARWIRRQLDYFRQFEPRTPPRKYVAGETHLYLGRQYRLKIHSGKEDQVKATRGFLNVFVEGKIFPRKIKILLDQWYEERARYQFQESLERCWKKFKKHGLVQPSLQARRMKTRWGSLSRHGTLALNIDLVRAPKECVDYVVIHELCHLKYLDHSAKFYEFLDKMMPDWKKRKENLERLLV